MQRNKILSVATLVASVAAMAQTPTQERTLNPLQLSPHHVTASVADLEKEAAWYERVLGFQRSARMGDANFHLYQMTMPGYRIDLAWQKDSVQHRVANGALEQGWLHVVFKTPDLDRAYKLIVSQGTDVKPVKDDGKTINRLTFHDPEGNELEIVQQ